MKKIGVITGTRAEYGLLKPLMERIKNDEELELYLIVTGMHLSPEFGLTYKDIVQDGFIINDKVEMLLSSDTPEGICKSIGLGIINFSTIFSKQSIDLLIVLGDRFEILAAVEAAYTFRIPIAHLHGGELTQGVIDDGFRHAITKMSTLHFVSTETYKKRVIQLGEQPMYVHNVGAIGTENIKKMKLLTKEELEQQLNFRLSNKYAVVTYHPITLKGICSSYAMNEFLEALHEFPQIRFIFTKANADTDGRIINKMIDDYVKENKNCISFTSLGQLRYFSALKYCSFVIGNSSSGLLEAPTFKIPTINIGERQKGRIEAKSVINCGETKEEIVNAIRHGISLEFRKHLRFIVNPYEKDNTLENIIANIKQFLSAERKIGKVFNDL